MWILMGLLLCVSIGASAEEEKPPLKAELGGSLIQASGNVSALTVGVHSALKYTSTQYSVSADGNYLRVNGDQYTQNEKIATALQLEHPLGKIVVPYAQASYGRDLQAGLYRQGMIEAGASVNILNTDTRWLILSGALSDTEESQLGRAPEDSRFWGGRARVKQRWPLGGIVALGSRSSLLLNFRESRDWRLDIRGTMATAISRLLALEVSHEVNYRHMPSPGKRSTDHTTLVSLVAVWPLKPKS
jgi:hypothetical protein